MKFDSCEPLIPAFLLVDMLVVLFYVYLHLKTLYLIWLIKQ